MAVSLLVPKNGAVAYGSQVADFMSFDIESSQETDNVTGYGIQVNQQNVGSGTPGISANVAAAAQAHAVNTPPLLTTLPGSALGSSCTFTLDTGVTEAFTAVTKSVRISHSRMRGAVAMAISLVNAGDVTETWATT